MSDDNIINIDSHEDPELETLYKQAVREMPPARLNQSIKQAARDAHTTGSKRKAYPWFAGVAASVIVGVLFLKLYPESLPEQPVRRSAEELPASLAPRPADTLEQERTVMLAEDNVAPTRLEPVASELASRAQAPKSEKLAKDRSMSESLGTVTGLFSDTEADVEPLSRSKQVSAQRETPAQILERIERLIDEGEIEQARKQLESLKKRFPDYEIRRDILDRLEQ